MTVKTAADLKDHLVLLEQERAVALDTGLGDDLLYMADLYEEIMVTRHAYVGSAVTEIASLRAALSGPAVG